MTITFLLKRMVFLSIAVGLQWLSLQQLETGKGLSLPGNSAVDLTTNDNLKRFGWTEEDGKFIEHFEPSLRGVERVVLPDGGIVNRRPSEIVLRSNEARNSIKSAVILFDEMPLDQAKDFAKSIAEKTEIERDRIETWATGAARARGGAVDFQGIGRNERTEYVLNIRGRAHADDILDGKVEKKVWTVWLKVSWRKM